jgi:ATP-dependent RNA helicase RhlE
MLFEQLGLNAALLNALKEKGYETPTTIQEKAIPVILAGKDVLASAQTGTGKTAGFALPLIQLLADAPKAKKRPVKALILTPTRELAAQIYDEFTKYGAKSGLECAVIFGGVNQNPQVARLRNGVDVLVATPGRLLDLVGQNLLTLTQVEYLVLDEADRMLDMGFIREIRRILALVPNRKQNLLFSATFSEDIKKLAATFLKDPVMVAASAANTTTELVDQKAFRVDNARKTELIIKLIWEGNWHQVLVFTRTKHGANRLSQKFEKANISSAAIHGNKTQNARTNALAGFKNGTISVLVATDIAARGLDIPLLPHVINFELPNVPEDYVHRIGRTGRAGASGEAISLVAADEIPYLRAIEKLMSMKIPTEVLQGFEPSAHDKPTEDDRPPLRGNSRPVNRRPVAANKPKEKRFFRN